MPVILTDGLTWFWRENLVEGSGCYDRWIKAQLSDALDVRFGKWETIIFQQYSPMILWMSYKLYNWIRILLLQYFNSDLYGHCSFFLNHTKNFFYVSIQNDLALLAQVCFCGIAI